MIEQGIIRRRSSLTFLSHGGSTPAKAVAKHPSRCHFSTATSFIVFPPYTLTLPSHPAVAKTVPSDRMERPCWPECFVAIVLRGLKGVFFQMERERGRWCAARVASAEEVR